MKRVIGPVAGLVSAVCLSGCAGLAGDPLVLAQALRLLNEGCERTVDLHLDKERPGGGSIRMTRVCAPVSAPGAAEEPEGPRL